MRALLRADGSLRLIPRLLVLAFAVALPAGVVAVGDLIGLLYVVPYAAIGAVLAIRRPTNLVGWLLVAIALAFVGTSQPGPLSDAQVASLENGTAGIDLALLTWFTSSAGG